MSERPVYPEIHPSPNAGEPPDFWRMEWKHFEELTCALFDKEPGVDTADLFHIDGQSQFGIDILANLSKSDEIEVVSCKCYETFTAGQVEAWSDAFLTHFETYWRHRKVRRFVLAVASSIGAQKISDEIVKQKARFRSLGLDYAAWGPRQLQEKLRPNRGIAAQYLGSYWTKQLCGDAPVGAEGIASGFSAILDQFANQVSPLLAALSGETDARLESLRQRLRDERPATIEAELNGMRTTSYWAQLSPNVRSKCLRYLAFAKLQRDDIDGATLLANEADAISSDGLLRLRALLLARRGDQLGALAMLETTTDPAALEVKVALLIEDGQLDDAERLVTSLTAGNVEPSAELARLRAFIALFRNQREEALAEIRVAEKLAPTWFAVRRAGALIRYASALSTAVGPEHYANPSPVALELVCEDDSSQQLLQEALSIFEKLESETTVGPNVVGGDEIWALACQCNLVDGSSAAQQRCSKMLDVAPQCPEAISWALGRGLTFDRARSIEALKEIVRASRASAGHVLAYSWLLSLEGRDKDARSLLEEHEALFRESGQRAAYEARIASLLDHQAGIAAHIGTESVELRLFAAIADVSGPVRWDQIELLFTEVANEKPRSTVLLATAARMASEGRWPFLASNVETLLRFKTASAVEIAIHAAYNAQSPQLALEILASNRSVFPQQIPPRNVRMIEVHGLAAQGEHKKALSAAERLASEFDGGRERLLAADVRIGVGDVRGALPIIRAGLADHSLKSEDALRFAQVAELEDKELARKLWKHALAQGVPTKLAIKAHMLAVRLGLENEAGIMGPAIAELANTPGTGTHFMTWEDARDQIDVWNKNRTNLRTSYLDGKAPFHVISEGASLNFGEHYVLGRPPITADSHAERLPLLIRHGARHVEFQTGIAFKDWRLHVDVSAMLLASQLGILEKIESTVARIIVPSSIQLQLFEMRDSLTHSVPAKIASARRIDSAIRSGKVQVSRADTTDVVTAEQRDAASTSWVISSSGDSGTPNFGLGQHASFRGVLEGLRRSGRLPGNDYLSALERVGFESNAKEAIPPMGARILFKGNELERWEGICPLESTLQTYVVCVDSQFAQHCASEVAQDDLRERSTAVFDDVRNHVATKLLDGSFEALPAAEVETNQLRDADAAKFMEGLTPMLGLSEFLRIASKPDAVFLCDDRYLSGYPGFGTAPLVGIFEVLRALKDANKLSESEYFEKLLQLRGSDAMFIPTSAQEVLYHLQRAPIHDGRITETLPLSVLRRYQSRVALLQRHLKIGSYPEHVTERHDETNILLSSRRLTDDCVTALWTSERFSDEQCAAMSTWVWMSLRAERHLGEHPSIKDDIDSVRTFVAVNFCSILATLFQMVTGNGATRKAAFSAWLRSVVIKGRFEADSKLVDSVASQLISLTDNLFSPTRDEHTEPYSDETIALYLRKAIDAFPEPIRERMHADKNMRKRLKTNSLSVVSLGTLKFLSGNFLTGVRKTLRFGKAKVRVHESDKRAVFESTDQQDALHVRYDGRIVRIVDPLFSILGLSDVDAVRRLLSDHQEWFDCTALERQKLANEILSATSAEKRFEIVDNMRRQTVVWVYANIEGQLREEGNLELERCSVPPVQNILGHLRLIAGDHRAFNDQWEEAAESLIEECGLAEAFVRLGSLPVPLPNYFVERFLASPSEMKASLFSKYVKYGSQSPVHFFHALRLLGSDGFCVDEVSGQANLVSDVLARWNDLSDAFTAVLSWVDAQASEVEGWGELNTVVQVVTSWSHAVRLFALLNRETGSEKMIAQYFKGIKSTIAPEAAFGGWNRSRDCSAPSTFIGVVLLYSGLNYATASSSSMLGAQEWEKVLSLIRVAGVTNPWLLSSRQSADNHLGSFMRIENLALPQTVAVPPEQIDDFENEVLRSLENEPTSPLHWIYLYTLARMGLRRTNYQRAVDIVAAADIASFSHASGQELICWRAVAGCINFFGNEQAREQCEDRLVELAFGLHVKHKSNEFPIAFGVEEARSKELAELVEACFYLSKSDKLTDAYGVIARVLSNVARIWPAAQVAIRGQLENIYEESRLCENSAIWTAYINVRAMG